MNLDTVVNVELVLVFVLARGVFASTEIALASLRASKLRTLEKQGGRGARTAKLAQDPNRFLSAVQIGVALAGLFSAALRRLHHRSRSNSHTEIVGLSPGGASANCLMWTL